MKRQTFEQMLSTMNNGDLLDIYLEIDSHIVPATGYAHRFCRKVNRLIDKGELCINPNSYRKVYLPTLVKALHKEMASRYAKNIIYGVTTNDDIEIDGEI